MFFWSLSRFFLNTAVDMCVTCNGLNGKFRIIWTSTVLQEKWKSALLCRRCLEVCLNSKLIIIQLKPRTTMTCSFLFDWSSFVHVLILFNIYFIGILAQRLSMISIYLFIFSLFSLTKKGSCKSVKNYENS